MGKARLIFVTNSPQDFEERAREDMAHWNPRLLKSGENSQDQMAAPDPTLRSWAGKSSGGLVWLSGGERSVK